MSRFLAVVGALAILLAAVGGAWLWRADPADRTRALVALGLRPDPLALAVSGLEAIRQEQQLSVLSARFMTKQTSQRNLSDLLPEGLIAAEKTLLVAGTVRYAMDLSKLDAADLSFDKAANTLSIRRPPLLIVGPSFHVMDMNDVANGAVVLWLTQSETELDRANWEKARTAIIAEARSDTLRQQAQREADAALIRLFALPLRAAGFTDVKLAVVG